MATRRKDSKGKVLREGESERLDGRYVYRYVDMFGKRHSVYAKNLNELRAKEKEIKEMLEEDSDLASGGIQFLKYAEEYLSMKLNIRHSTREHYMCFLNALKKEEWAYLNMREIKPIHIKKYLYEQAAEGMSYATLNNKYAFIRAIFNDAVDNRILRYSPCIVKLKNITKPEEKEIRYLTKEQQKDFFEFLEQDTIGKKKLMILNFMVNTGLRFGELSGLTWNDIDLEEGCIKVTHQLIRSKGKVYHIDKPKTECATRIVYMPYDLIQEMKRYRKEPRPKIEPMIDGYTGFVFLNRDGRVLDNVNFNTTMQQLRKKYIEKTGNDIGTVSAHVFRHTYCSRLVERGVPIKVVQYTMGHANISTTMNIYTHIDMEDVKNSIRKAQ